MPSKAHKTQGTAPVERTVWLTTDQAAARAGLKRSGLRSRVRVGLLREYRGSDGRPRFDAAEVDLMMQGKPPRQAKRAGSSAATAEAGALAARAYTLIADGGADRRRLVRELEIPPELADELFTAYHRQGETFAVPYTVAAELALKLRVVEPFTSDAGLVEAVKRGIARLEGERHRQLEEKDTAYQKLEAQLHRVECEAELHRERAIKAETEARKARAAEQSARNAAEGIAAIIAQAAAAGAAGAAAPTSAPEVDAEPGPSPSPAAPTETPAAKAP